MSIFSETPFNETLRKIARGLPGVDMPALETCFAMRQATIEILAAVDASLSRGELSRPRCGVLVLLLYHEEAGLTPAELAEQLFITRASMTGLLDGLESAGFVTREPHATDRRMVTVRITDDGKQALADTLPAHFQRMSQVMGKFSQAEQETLVNLMRRVAAEMGSLPSK